MLAEDVMTRAVTFVHPDTPIADAAAKMALGHISGLPVVDKAGALVGIVTEGDLLRRVELGTAPNHSSFMNFLRGPGLSANEYVRTHTLSVEDVMTPELATVGPKATLGEIVSCMERHHVRRVPVVEEGSLLGIVSRADLVRELHRQLEAGRSGPRSDDAIREDILAEMKRQHWHTLCNVSVEVRDGMVTLTGMAQSEPVLRALRVAATCVRGVTSVANEVTVLDPMTAALGM